MFFKIVIVQKRIISYTDNRDEFVGYFYLHIHTYYFYTARGMLETACIKLCAPEKKKTTEMTAPGITTRLMEHTLYNL